MAVYEQWLAHRCLSLEEGRQTSLEQIGRVFKKDVFPSLRHLTIYEITRAHLLDIIGTQWCQEKHAQGIARLGEHGQPGHGPRRERELPAQFAEKRLVVVAVGHGCARRQGNGPLQMRGQG
ncbi:hypothetical protein ACT6QG_12620 [Xanthobacter sp. TB0136]|uniref:hypothetical protein n=1 Tax=Xanthobacter sp. TB0136 TaxID=3459177 RepID=UPI0040398D64